MFFFASLFSGMGSVRRMEDFHRKYYVLKSATYDGKDGFRFSSITFMKFILHMWLCVLREEF